jgi:hypothetical protein
MHDVRPDQHRRARQNGYGDPSRVCHDSPP